jgi:hypothetical protein
MRDSSGSGVGAKEPKTAAGKSAMLKAQEEAKKKAVTNNVALNEKAKKAAAHDSSAAAKTKCKDLLILDGTRK